MRSLGKLILGAMLAVFAVSMVAVPLTAGPPSDFATLEAAVQAKHMTLAIAPAMDAAITAAAMQETSGPTTPVGVLVLAVLVPLLGYIGTKLYDGLKTVFPWYDKLPAVVHQVAAPLLQAGFGFVGAALAVPVLTDLKGVTAQWIIAVLTSLGSAGIKRWEKSKDPSDATIALQRSRESQPI